MALLDEIKTCEYLAEIFEEGNCSFYITNVEAKLLRRLLNARSSWLHGLQLQKKEQPMSTNDVPGANPTNADVLKALCWAEHADGSMILVLGTENNNVIYDMFDVSKSPPMFFRDSMPEVNFKPFFTWKPGSKNEKWTWHDKTPFPWNRVIKKGFTDGPQVASASDHRTAYERVRAALKKDTEEQVVQEGNYSHLIDTTRIGKETAKIIRNNLLREVGKLDQIIDG